MNQSDIREFYATFQRFLSLLEAIWQFVYYRIRSKPIIQVPAIKSSKQIQNEYLSKYKTRLLSTFDDNNTNWDSNVDVIINDKDKLGQLLEDKHNYLEKKWRSTVLIENTPRGNLIMFYDIYKNSFSYYCDQAIVPYDVANAAAMKYVMTFRCRSFFVDSNILPTPVVDTPSKSENSTTINKPEDKNGPFAKFKSYNTTTKKAAISSENDKRINSFSHLGGTRNWTPIIKPPKINPINGFKTDLIPGERKLSYLDYKKMKQIS